MKRTYSQIDLDRALASGRSQCGDDRRETRPASFDDFPGFAPEHADVEMPDLTCYFCVTAHGKANKRRSRHRKLARHPLLQAAISERIKHGWSPEQIAGRLAYERSSVRVCHETIYRFAYSSDGQDMKLWRHLAESRARRRPRHARRRYGRRFSP